MWSCACSNQRMPRLPTLPPPKARASRCFTSIPNRSTSPIGKAAAVFLAHPDPMLVLGIETSCDETAAALVTEDGTVVSDSVHSQIKLHAPYGGVVPELA